MYKSWKLVAAIVACVSCLNAAGQVAETMRKHACYACHADDRKLVGPSFNDIRARYRASDGDAIASAIMQGSQGKWGPVPMPPNTGVSRSEAMMIASALTGASLSSAPTQAAGVDPASTGRPPDSPAPARSASTGSNRPSHAQCFEMIREIQRTNEPRRATEMQRDLFEGQCAHHPQASEYARTARQILDETGASDMSRSSSASTNPNVFDYPVPDANQCIQVKGKAGANCGNPRSKQLEFINRCATVLNVQACMLQRDGKWDCGTTGRMKPNEGMLRYICDGNGLFGYAACTLSGMEGKRYRSGNCGGNPNKGGDVLVYPKTLPY